MESKPIDKDETKGSFLQIEFAHSKENMHSGDFGTVDDAIVNSPRVPVQCIIKVLDGRELFKKPDYKDIKKNCQKIENEVKFLL